MKPRIRRLVVIGAGAQRESAPDAAGRPGPGGHDVSALAAKLGVTESRLLAPAGGAGNGTPPPGTSTTSASAA
jgi:hypothetical protein